MTSVNFAHMHLVMSNEVYSCGFMFQQINFYYTCDCAEVCYSHPINCNISAAAMISAEETHACVTEN